VVSTAARFVAADASPLIGLAAAGVFDVLRKLFGTIAITRLVKDEVARGADLPGARELDDALRMGWIRVAPTPLETWRFAELDAGEASTLALASGHAGALVLMDDTRGRAQAAALGLEVLDVADLLLAAKRAGHVAAVQPLVARMTRRGFTLREDARVALLRTAGECILPP
jgi:predicted nucleic acid-binding protein